MHVDLNINPFILLILIGLSVRMIIDQNRLNQDKIQTGSFLPQPYFLVD
jgi:hypothetical protein